MAHELPGFALHHRVGVGATAAVYRAEAVGSPGRIVAVKRLHLDATPEAVEDLRREAAVLARLSHPSLLRILEIVPDGDRIALVLPFAVGGSLADRLASAIGGLPAREVADLGARLGGALATAHDARLVHRDVKPSNVLFDAEGQPILGDFGMARLCNEPAPVAGTAEYVDPAVVNGARPDARTDVYGLGVTLFEALAGVPPYAGSTPGQTLAAADRAIHVPLGDLTDAPPELVTIVERAMNRDPACRYQTARELAGQLRVIHTRLEADQGDRHVTGSPPGSGRAGVLGAITPGSKAHELVRLPPVAWRERDEVTIVPTVPTVPSGPTGIRPTGPTGRTGTRRFGPAPPRPSDVEAAGRSVDRRLLAIAAILALLLPVGVASWLLRGGDEVGLTTDQAAPRNVIVDQARPDPVEPDPPDAVPGPGHDVPAGGGADEAVPSEASAGDPAGGSPSPEVPVVDAGRPSPECPDVQPLDVGTDHTVVAADVHGRGCTVPLRWDGRHLDVPVETGGTVRYDLAAASGDVLLLGDWSCDGRDTPALYRPADGRLFVFDTFGDEVTARGSSSGVPHGDAVVVTDADGCQRIEIEATS